MRVCYTYLEVESIENDYDQQVPISTIAENVNRDFHNGIAVRTASAISAVVYKIHNDDAWKQRLEDKWLSKIS
jgi:hypothetical protein